MTDQRRALLTEREREIIAGEADVTDNYRYSVESRIRTRLRDRLPEDVALLNEHLPEVFDDLVYPAVCQPVAEKPDATQDGSSPSETATTSTPSPTDEAESTVSDTSPSSTGSATNAPPERVAEDVADAVEAVAGEWQDSAERLEQRKRAAQQALQQALADGPVGKSDLEELCEEVPVEGQNFETWWRKNVRPVLSAYGTYDNDVHGYRVDNLKTADST